MKYPKILVLVFSLMLIIAPLVSCASQAPTYPVTTLVPPSEEQNASDDFHIQPVAFKPVDKLESNVSKALADFSLDLFQRMEAQDAGQNVFVSPLSVWLALGMTYNGASGDTAQGMAKALHAEGIPIGDLNAANAGLMGVLTAADPKVQIAIANSIWMRQNVAKEFNEAFLDTDRQYYAAQIEALDFGDAGAADKMNAWVEQNTNGNIKNLVEPPIDPATVMFLINAVHFKAPWKIAFDEKSTRDGAFTAAGGTDVQAKFLFSEEGNFGFADRTVTAARIPYASGRLEMVALMPGQGSLADFVGRLSPETLQTYIDKCRETQMSLLFPKFKVEYKAKLNDALIAMGMEKAFTTADFSNMSESMGKQLVISEVKHKSFIEVNEEGTEASAATSVEMRLTAVMETSNLEFTKPFVYLIRDSMTGAILFIGTMEDPS
jgi:serine protease inhibitor